MSGSPKNIAKPVIEYICPPFKVLKSHVLSPNQTEYDYYSVFKGKTNQYVCIIGINNKEEIILVNEWRPTTNEWDLSLPMGAVEENESPQEAARREFVEETGYFADNLVSIGEFYESPGHSAQKGYVFLATNISKSTDTRFDDESEVIQVQTINKRSLIDMIASGKFKDGSSLNSLAIFLAIEINKL